MVYVSQPLDTVKVKMQTFPKLYTGMVSCFMTTLKRDGVVRGLYAGNEFNECLGKCLFDANGTFYLFK